jgi:hypothetical protein
MILATWEAKIGRITFLGQFTQGIHKTPSQPIAGHGGVYLSSQATWEAEIRPAWAKKKKKEKLHETHISTKKLGIAAPAHHPSDSRKPKRGSLQSGHT